MSEAELETAAAKSRLHLATEGEAAKTVRTYTEAVAWFAAAHLIPALPGLGGAGGRAGRAAVAGCQQPGADVRQALLDDLDRPRFVMGDILGSRSP